MVVYFRLVSSQPASIYVLSHLDKQENEYTINDVCTSGVDLKTAAHPTDSKKSLLQSTLIFFSGPNEKERYAGWAFHFTSFGSCFLHA